MGATYRIDGGLTSDLTSPLAGVSISTTAKTVLQLIPDPNYAVSIIQWGFTMLGSTLGAAPVLFELLDTGTVAATGMTTGNVAKWGGPTGPASQATGAAFGPATAEGSITATRLLDHHAYPADWASQFPLGREPHQGAGNYLRIRATNLAASGTVLAVPFIIYEIG